MAFSRPLKRSPLALIWQVCFEIGELFQELLEAEAAFEVGEEVLDPPVQPRQLREPLVKEGEPGVDERLVARDPAGGVVVRARIGDAAAEHVEILVHHDGLGRGGAEIDADEATHGVLAFLYSAAEAGAFAPCRFCSIIWK